MGGADEKRGGVIEPTNEMAGTKSGRTSVVWYLGISQSEPTADSACAKPESTTAEWGHSSPGNSIPKRTK